jgi:endonuclease YncB( thermonuclease family)
MDIDWSKYDNSVKLFNFEGEKKIAKVVDVYDGDTVKVVFPVHNTFYRWNCRLIKVDTPELRTRCKLQKQYGYKVRDALREKILNKVVLIHCDEFDKYGRLLVSIYEDIPFTPIQNGGGNVEAELSNVKSVNDWLIESNYAFYYDGGTKNDWSEFLKENPDLLDL